MAPAPIVTATLQSAVLAATANILAQAITAYNQKEPLVFDWIPLFQFTLYALISTPPNFMWQDFLESTFPAFHVAPTAEAIASASANDEKALDREASEGKLVEPRLNLRNTAAKLVLDQTVSAAINTFAFSLFIHSIRAAMEHHYYSSESSSSSSNSLLGALSSFSSWRGAVDYGNVRWDDVVAASRDEFWGFLVASWRLWPAVSLLNFSLVKTLEMRNLVGGLAGVAWGVYINLVVGSS